MSLVNQVLNDLEKRGVNVAQADAALRAVPVRKQVNWLPYAFAAILLLLFFVAARWYRTSDVPVVEPTAVAAVNPARFELVPGISDAANVSSVPGAASMVDAEPEIVEQPVPEIRKKSTRRSAERLRANSPDQYDQAGVASTGLPMKVVNPQQRAESEFGKANQAVQAGRTDEALAGYERALLSDPNHKASRRAWVALLLKLKRNDDAERVLQKGMRRDPHDATFAMLMARLQVERNAVPEALETLQKNLADAADQADYQAFMAVLLQRQERHQEAAAYFQKALKLKPNNGVWLMGMGISLQAAQHIEEARAAYQLALISNSLSPQLREYVQQKLKEL